MEVEELVRKLMDNIDDVLTPSGYRRIINRDNALFNYDSLNRILIDMQNCDVSELRSPEDWLIHGRKVKSDARAINLILPNYKSKYVDPVTSETVDVSDLSSVELQNALGMSIVVKRDDIQELFVVQLYDIEDTIMVDYNEQYIGMIIQHSIRNVLNTFQEITKAEVVIDTRIVYDAEKNILYVDKVPYTELVLALSPILANYIMNNKLEDILLHTLGIHRSDLEPIEIELIEKSLVYSIKTLWHVNDFEADFHEVVGMDNGRIVNILNVIDACLVEAVEQLKLKKPSDKKDIISTMLKLRKSEALLNILEANYVRTRLGGA